jgi:hypothetical protein
VDISGEATRILACSPLWGHCDLERKRVIVETGQ